MRTLSIAFGFFLIIFTFGITSCSKTGSIEGKWVSLDGQENIEFLKDGTFRGHLKDDMSQSLSNISGTYFIEGTKLSLTPKGDSPMTWEFKLSGNELIVTFTQGGSVKLNGSMAKYRRP